MTTDIFNEPLPNSDPAVRCSAVLSDLKARYDAFVEREKQHRLDLNAMRRDLVKISRERKAAYRAWQSEANIAGSKTSVSGKSRHGGRARRDDPSLDMTADNA